MTGCHGPVHRRARHLVACVAAIALVAVACTAGETAEGDPFGQQMIDEPTAGTEPGREHDDQGHSVPNDDAAPPTGSESPTTGSAPAAPLPVDAPTNGPLIVSQENPRYFADASGRAVLLVGAHTWLNFQDGGPTLPPGDPFDDEAYLDVLVTNGHNFTRLWVWEQAVGLPSLAGDVRFGPLPYVRTGPGAAADGEPRFDLDRFEQAYFDRLRSRVQAAGDRGIYVAVMLFNGWSLEDKGGPGNPCPGHPFHRDNNVNGIDVDVDDDGMCDEAHRLTDPEVTAYQEAYVAKVVDTVGDLDNVLYEISNESPRGSHEWQYHMIDHLNEYQGRSDVAHPVGMTVEYPDGDNAVLVASAADWISPNAEGGFRDEPPMASGDKVMVLDTDHLWGVGGDASWVWRAVTRGHNLLYMDCYDLELAECEGVAPVRASTIRNMGVARAFASRMDLTRSSPSASASSSGFALASDAGEFLVFVPGGGPVTVDPGDAGAYDLAVEWFDPWREEHHLLDPVATAGPFDLEAPFPGDAVLFLHPSVAGSDGS